MATRKAFLIRLDPAVLTALEAWAADDLRSVNGQIEFVLRDALRKAGRKIKAAEAPAANAEAAEVSAEVAAPAAKRARR